MPARLAVPPTRESGALEHGPAPEGWGLGAVVTARAVQLAAVGGDGTHISDDSSALPVGTEPLDAAWRVIAHAVRRLTAEAEESRTTIAGLTVALPGVVDSARGLVYDAAGDRAPVAAHDLLARRIGSPPSSLRLAALGRTAAAAEARATGAGLASVLCYLSADDEVACGVVSRGRALTGAEGLAGQVGHLQLDPLGHECFCGRRGCWVTVIGLPALLRHATDPDDPVRDPMLDVDAQIAEIERRARLEDGRTRRALAETGHALGVGIAMLSGLLDPDVVVLGGYLGALLPYVLPACEAARRAPHHRPDSPLGRITASRVTASDVARSAALAALTAGGEGVVG